MAAAVAVHFLSLSPALQIAGTTSSSPKILSLALPLHHDASRNSFSAFKIRYSSHYSRKSFRDAAKIAGTDPKSITEDEEDKEMEIKSKSLKKQNDSMKVLIQAYKEAFLNGDEKSVSEMEALICTIERETNELLSKSTELISEIKSIKDKFLRLNADFENLRKRLEKDRHTFTSDKRAEVIERLLPIVDTFERVRQQIKLETERERKIDTSYQGIYRQFVEIVRSMRVSVVETVGRPFDPSIHEAVSREKSHQFKSGIVMQELRRGFVSGDRVLRQASVKVSTGPGPEKASFVVAKSMEQPVAAAKYLENSATPSTKS